MPAKVLFVDDDDLILAAYRRTLRKRFAVDTAPGGQAALEVMRTRGPYAVVLSDMGMPGMDGIRFLSEVRSMAPDTVRIMLTGQRDLEIAVKAVNEGNIFRFLTKPCRTDELEQILETAIRQHELATVERELLEKTVTGTIQVLAEILSIMDPASFGRAQRLREIVGGVVPLLQLPRPWEVEAAALLLGIGEVTVPPDTLARARAGEPISGPERHLLENVPDAGAELLRQIPRLEGVARIMQLQRGRPAPGTELPIEARLLRTASALLDLEAAGRSRSEAIEHLRRTEGGHDPAVLGAFQKNAPVEAAGPHRRPEQAVTTHGLRLGQRLRSDVKTSDGVLLLSKGQRISVAFLLRIRNFASLLGVQEPILVEDGIR